jgi:lipopolysaccharide export system ATP-binding protein
MEEPRIMPAARVISAPFSHLSVQSLCVTIAGQLVVRDVSLEVSQGEIVGLLGRDGAGKTSCFDAIAGTSRTSRGQVRLNGMDVTGWPIDRRARSGLAYLCEDVSTFRGLTVEENILAALELAEPIEISRRARLEELLHELQLERVRYQLATTISGGERRRCEVARALALSPGIFLLDEPFKGLDPLSIQSTKHLIATLKCLGIGVLMSDYDLRALVGVMDRAYVLHRGQVIFSGTTAELLADDDVRQLYLGKTFVL